jgi:crotonobetainyl-CoA:carnitine CoA-transferase CaiB-like acyl-CoA transferase
MERSKGPLKGIKVVELAGYGPGPMCAMMLADMGATVIRVDRAVPDADALRRRPSLRFDLTRRGRRAIGLDLKKPDAIECVLKLVEQSDAFIEGYRPGVVERLGLGPDICLGRNPALVYGRITGWGQTGPLAMSPGHDLNYIALTGALNAIGRRGQPPSIPLILVGDMGGGAMYLTQGILAGIIEARTSGRGQVVDAAMVDGAASLSTNVYGRHASGAWLPERGTNLLDSGAHFYEVYECSDGRWVAVGANEKKFYDELLRRLDLDPAALGDHLDRSRWEENKRILAARFRTRTRDEWCQVFEGAETCFSPVLDFEEAPRHPHMQARGTFVTIDGVTQPAPAPRFSRTPSGVGMPPQPITPENTDLALADWFSSDQIAALRAAGTIE